MPWLFVPGLADSNSEYASPFLRPGLCVMWRGNSMPPTSSPGAWRMAQSSPLLFTLTCDASTVDRGVESWISSLLATRASPSVSRASSSEQQIQGTSGPKSHESSPSQNRVSSSSKTSQATSRSDSGKSSETLHRSGSMRSGEFSAQPAAEPPISGGDSSVLLPTPAANSHGTSGNGCPGDGREEYAHKGTPSLDTMARQNAWPTPTASDSKRGETGDGEGRDRPGPSLAEAVKRWPTPTAGDSRSSGSRATPGSKAHPGTSLTDAVVRGTNQGRFPTPVAGDATRGPSTYSRGNPSLLKAVHSVGDGEPGQLNPTWVEWLMGLPIGWTVSGPLETQSFQQWLREHS